MDEITIGDKTYVSSKQAAKITGYAKDYVGQLCREGRVEARLVGRNWYVLDSAIREHRFGKVEEKPVIPEPEAGADRVSTWQKPQYEAETPVLVPGLEKKAPESIGSPAIADMQSAWREWFEEKKTPQATLPDGSEDFKDEYLPLIVPEEPVELHKLDQEAPEIKAEESEMVVISRIRHQPETEIHDENESTEGETVAVHRSYATTTTPRKEYEDEITKMQQVGPLPIPKTYVPETKKTSTSVVVRALLIAISFMVALIALIGTGNAEQLLSGTSLDFGVQRDIVDFLGGKSTYESSL